MKVDLQPFENWEVFNSLLQEELGELPGQIIRTYAGLSAGLIEIALGSSQFYSHKRVCGVISGRSPFVAPLLPILYKEGFQVEVKPHSLTYQEWAAALPKETNFVISVDDHPVTGEIFYDDQLDALLNERKIFHFRLSHHSHFLNLQSPLRPYTVQLCSWAINLCLGRLGTKIKIPPFLAPAMYWDVKKEFEKVKKIRAEQRFSQDLILQFEAQVSSVAQIYFQNFQSQRLFDRSVLIFDQLGGEALQQYVARQIGVLIESPGFETQIETTHECRWGGVNRYQSWWDPCPSAQVLRGMLVLGLDVIQNPQLLPTLKVVAQECQVRE